MYRVATDRAASYAYLIMIGSRLDGRNLPQISRIHAKIEEDGDGYRITDLNSTNGTGVNGRFLETNESVHIEPGEMLSFADQRYRFL